MKIQTLGLQQPERRNITAPVLNSDFWEVLGGGSGTEAGESISDATAMQISTVFSCIRILAESIAALPIKLFKVTDKGRIQEIAHPLHFLLSIAPNDECTSFSLVETMVAHLALTGNCYAQIQRGADGSPIALWNLQPRQTEPYRLPSGLLAYRTTDGEKPGQSRILAAKDVIHVPLTTWDGVCGLSPIMQAKRTLGMSIAAEKFGPRLFANFAVPQMVLKTDKKLKAEDIPRMRQDWENYQTGSSQHRVNVLSDGMTIEKMSITPEEGQFLETRQYTRSEIASLFRVPAHMIGELQKMSNSNTENMNLSFVVNTLRPYLSRIEAEFTKKLLPREAGKVSDLQVQFDVTERLRGDYASQTAGAATGRQWGWLTGNDVRRSMGLNEGGPELDVFINPVNMANSARLLDAPPAPTQKDLVPDV